jgi:hypothetical protein
LIIQYLEESSTVINVVRIVGGWVGLGFGGKAGACDRTLPRDAISTNVWREQTHVQYDTGKREPV